MDKGQTCKEDIKRSLCLAVASKIVLKYILFSILSEVSCSKESSQIVHDKSWPCKIIPELQIPSCNWHSMSLRVWPQDLDCAHTRVCMLWAYKLSCLKHGRRVYDVISDYIMDLSSGPSDCRSQCSVTGSLLPKNVFDKESGLLTMSLPKDFQQQLKSEGMNQEMSHLR